MNSSYASMCAAARFRAAAVLAAYATALTVLRAWTPPGTRTDVIATGAAVTAFTSILTRASQ